MAILDTFILLFESDASKLDKGLTESGKKADALTQQVTKTDQVASKLGETFRGTLATIGGAIAATASIAALGAAFREAAHYADQLDETAERTGVAVETLSAWGDLVRKSGGSVESFVGSVEGLNLMLAQMEVTGKSRAAPFLKELGIDLDDVANKGKSAVEFFPQLADAFAALDQSKAMALGRRLGLDAPTIMTLRQGRREVEELLAKEKELGVVTAEQAAIAARYNDTLDDTAHAWRSVKMQLMTALAPAITWVFEKMQAIGQYIAANGDYITGWLIALGAAIAVKVVPALWSMAAAGTAAMAPFLPIIAIISGVLALAAAFALLYEDVMVFVEGGESVTGLMLKKWPLIGEVVRGIGAALKKLWATAKEVGQFFVDMWNRPGEMFSKFIDKLKAGIAAIPFLKGAQFNADIATGKAMVDEAARSPMSSVTSQAISNSKTSTRSTNVQVGKVEVKTQATDAEGISKAIGGSLQAQMAQAINNFDDGVMA